MVTTALVFLFKSQPVMLDSVPQLGHLPRILQAMTARNDAFPKHAIQIMHQLSNSQVGQNFLGIYFALQPFTFTLILYVLHYTTLR